MTNDKIVSHRTSFDEAREKIQQNLQQRERSKRYIFYAPTPYSDPVLLGLEQVWADDALDTLEEEFRVGGFYLHKKTRGIYKVLAAARHSETQEDLVVYRDLKSGSVWVRPRAMFLDGRFRLMGWWKSLWVRLGLQ